MGRWLQIALVCLWVSGAWAQVYEPERGSAERAAMLDAIRPHAEVDLGAPVEFVVRELWVNGDRGFAMLEPQRPGGVAIEIDRTPMVARGEDPDMIDGTGMQVFYVLSGETWVALHWAIGPTEAWWITPEFCADFGEVMPEYC